MIKNYNLKAAKMFVYEESPDPDKYILQKHKAEKNPELP
jgi:hypothetical protein